MDDTQTNTSSSNQYWYKSLLPGSIGGGQVVTLLGSGFDNMTTVELCGKLCDMAGYEVLPGSIMCKTPQQRMLFKLFSILINHIIFCVQHCVH